MIIVCLLWFPVSFFGQEILENEEKTEEPEMQSSVTCSGASYDFIFSWKKKATESHWTGLGFAFSNLDRLKNADIVLGRSYSILLNLMDYTISIDPHWLFVAGLGMDWTRYHFKGNTGLKEDADGTNRFIPDENRFIPDELNREFKSNKLLAYYVTIPLLLEYQLKFDGNKLFFVHGGLEGLIKYYSKSQLDIKTSEGIRKVEYKDLNILPINARLILRAGFDDFSIFGYYQPFSMFQKGKGPEIYPYGLGVMFNF
ncbi:MAG: PorT family protein [Candidatus Azobacteroides sp.]|nr:PorT family protein [Candidatus Azobacteroides sp.]